MPKRPGQIPSTTAFSIARQFTGPPFSAMLESAELRRHLMEELAHPHDQNTTPPVAVEKAAPGKKSTAKRRPKKAKK